MAVKPTYLVHWSGKDICIDINDLDDNKRLAYIERLKSILKEGLWMKSCEDTLVVGFDSPNQDIHERDRVIQYETTMTCFTELKVSNSYEHAKRYGLLGIAYSRDFIAAMGGRPVHYYGNEQDDPIAVPNGKLLLYLYDNAKDTIDKFGGNPLGYWTDMLLFIKPMSTPGTYDFKYIDESEWRIVNGELGKPYFTLTHPDGSEPSSYEPFGKFLFPLREVKTIILPDARTRHLLYQSDLFKDLISGDSALILSLEELRDL